ncbi:MAG: T9SS type A sorting domain-containing protein, partial [Bacteroidales bacterium]|nr:T9SS type A sorting domain-containing protein [Bacteroidales bacterium]
LGQGGEPCQMTWTIGEPMGETYAGSKKIISQGFLQGKGFIRDTVDMDTAWTPLAVETERLVEILCYPNPTHGPLQVVLNPVGAVGVVADVVLTDMQGRRLYRGSAGRLPWQETLDLSAYPAGTYLLGLTLRLSLDGHARQTETVRVKTYKIIKN